MSDYIRRQAVISAICNACGKIDCDKMDKCEKLQLPPANCSEFPNNSDTISRQAAIEALGGNEPVGDPSKMDDDGVVKMWERIRIINIINKLPSAQPEVIRCKDCKHYYFADNRIPQEQRYVCEISGEIWNPDNFCSYGKRKE